MHQAQVENRGQHGQEKTASNFAADLNIGRCDCFLCLYQFDLSSAMTVLSIPSSQLHPGCKLWGYIHRFPWLTFGLHASRLLQKLLTCPICGRQQLRLRCSCPCRINSLAYALSEMTHHLSLTAEAPQYYSLPVIHAAEVLRDC